MGDGPTATLEPFHHDVAPMHRGVSLQVLARIHMLAGRNLTALRPYSCFSLNARANAPLYGGGELSQLPLASGTSLLTPLLTPLLL